MNDYGYIVKYYGVPACTGRRVMAYGKPGVIAENMGHRIGIVLDCDKPGNIKPYHPVDGIEYLPEIVNVRPMTRSQKRYLDFLKEADCWDDFGHYLRCLK